MEASESSSEDEFDQQELEVALYSQTHFDTGPSPETNIRTSRPQFRIGVHELPPRTIHPSSNQPLDLGSFIAFSENFKSSDDMLKCEELCHTDTSLSCVEMETTENLNAKLKKELFDSSTCPEFMNDTFIPDQRRLNQFKMENNGSEFESNELKPEVKLEPDCNTNRVSKLTEPQSNSHAKVSPKLGAVNDSKKIGGDREVRERTVGQNKRNEKFSQTASHPSETPTEWKLLPFQITKKPKISRSIETVKEDDTLKQSVHHEQSNNKSKGTKKKSVAKQSKLPEFLELSQSDQAGTPQGKISKQKSLSKGEAAVQRRKPQVQVRRPPPPAVPVRYRPDSDTDTDYSDDGTTGHPTPTKKTQQKISCNSSDPSPCGATAAQGVAGDMLKDSDVEKSQKVYDVKEELVVSSTVEAVLVSSDSGSESSDDDDDAEEEEEEEIESDDSDSSSAAEIDAGNFADIPGLDFNLAGGVSGLLSERNEEDMSKQSEDNWKIDEKDRYSVKSSMSRYFAPRPIQCRNCRKEGHLSRDCPEPLRQRCIYCCEEGHHFRNCPQAFCYNCSGPGHKTTECKEPRMDWNTPCDRCWMTGHKTEMCPDIWRQMHLSLNPIRPCLRKNHIQRIQTDETKNQHKSCYNCGKKGHWGYECRVQRMNRFVAPSYPFIAFYDRKSDIKKLYLPSGMSHREVQKDAKMEKELRRLTRKIEKDGIYANPKVQRSLERLKKQLDQSRKNIANQVKGEDERQEHSERQTDAVSKRNDDYIREPSRPRRKKEHYVHNKSPEKLSRGTKANSKFSSNSEIPVFNSFLERPSTSKADIKTDRPRFPEESFTSKLSKSKRQKLQHHGHVERTESEDSLEDMANHQVSQNEWWLQKPEDEIKKRCRAGKRIQEKRLRRLQSSNETRMKHHENRHDARDVHRNENHFPPPSSKPETMFVYVDNEIPYGRTEPFEESERFRDYDNYPAGDFSYGSEHHPSNFMHDEQYWYGERSPARASKSKSIHVYTRERQSRGRTNYGSDHAMRNDHGWKRGKERHRSTSSNPHSRNLKHKAPDSGSGPRENKRRKAEYASYSGGGFKARHDRFLSMKNSCDIRVSMRK